MSDAKRITNLEIEVEALQEKLTKLIADIEDDTVGLHEKLTKLSIKVSRLDGKCVLRISHDGLMALVPEKKRKDYEEMIEERFGKVGPDTLMDICREDIQQMVCDTFSNDRWDELMENWSKE